MTEKSPQQPVMEEVQEEPIDTVIVNVVQDNASRVRAKRSRAYSDTIQEEDTNTNYWNHISITDDLSSRELKRQKTERILQTSRKRKKRQIDRNDTAITIQFQQLQPHQNTDQNEHSDDEIPLLMNKKRRTIIID